MRVLIQAVLFACLPTALAQPPAPTAGDIENPAVLAFEILDPAGARIPGRVTFRSADDPRPDLFPNHDAAPEDLAVRRNVVYAIRGHAEVTVPPGAYTIWFSRGMEWSVQGRTVDLNPGETTRLSVTLRHELDTTGWISGDFHLHTLTHSGHGDSNMPERVISLVGEGVEFAVATDHNHHTDYQPTMDRVGAGPHMTGVTGNEVSTSFGHFNAFPLEPGPAVEHTQDGARPLFALIREQSNRFGAIPIIQVNHPRWAGIDYFTKASLDPVTGATGSDVWSDDFDTIEVFNENEGWGYLDPDTTDSNTGSNHFSVLRDWFNLLNRGHRYAAVGNSDSHTVESEIAGVPRNFVASPTDDPADIDPADVADALRDRHVFTTTGPFVAYTVNAVPMGGDVRLDPGSPAEIALRVAAASWIDCDRVKIVVNGDVVHTIDVPDTRAPERLETTWSFTPTADCWVALLVEGDDPMTDIVHDQGRPIHPWAVANPVWIDADADGRWSSPRDQALARARDGASASDLAAGSAAKRALAVQAAASINSPAALDLAADLLGDEARDARLAAARAAETLADPALVPDLAAALDAAGDDRLLAVAILRAMHACGVDTTDRALALLDESSDGSLMARFRPDLEPLLAGDADFVRTWQVAAFFDNPEPSTLVTTDYGPETDPRAVRIYAGKAGTVRWRTIEAEESGYVDLRALDPVASTDAIAYLQAWLVSPDTREVHLALGTDDGARLWINDELVVEDNTRHAAAPFQTITTATLRKGSNRILLKVENGGGDAGAYLRVLDPDVTSSPTRPLERPAFERVIEVDRP